MIYYCVLMALFAIGFCKYSYKVGAASVGECLFTIITSPVSIPILLGASLAGILDKD